MLRLLIARQHRYAELASPFYAKSQSIREPAKEGDETERRQKREVGTTIAARRIGDRTKRRPNR